MTTVDRQDHDLYRRYPLTGEHVISTGGVPTPYHVYDGTILFIGGTADLGAVKALLQREQVSPLETEDHRALMAIWVCDFTQASLGAHRELQFSIFVSYVPLPPIGNHPLTILKLIATNPQVKMLCHRLWNDSDPVVAYNRELLSLDAQLMRGNVQNVQQQIRLHFADVKTNRELISGQIAEPRRTGMRKSVAMVQVMGLAGMIKVARTPVLSLQVVNTISEQLPHNYAAQTYTKNDQQAIRFFDPLRDKLDIHDDQYGSLGFVPHFVSYSTGCRFIYLEPRPVNNLVATEL